MLKPIGRYAVLLTMLYGSHLFAQQAQLCIPAAWIKIDNPAVLYSFGTSFLVYLLLARLGLQANTINPDPIQTYR